MVIGGTGRKVDAGTAQNKAAGRQVCCHLEGSRVLKALPHVTQRSDGTRAQAAPPLGVAQPAQEARLPAHLLARNAPEQSHAPPPTPTIMQAVETKKMTSTARCQQPL